MVVKVYSEEQEFRLLIDRYKTEYQKKDILLLAGAGTEETGASIIGEASPVSVFSVLMTFLEGGLNPLNLDPNVGL